MTNHNREEFESVDIRELAFGGDGVATRTNGKVVFVPLTTVGDRVSISIVEDKKDFSRGKVQALTKAGAARVVPPCDAFSSQKCGGCSWLHVSPEGQRDALMAQVKRTLQKVSHEQTEISWATEPSPKRLQWRRRAKVHWFKNPKTGRVRLGFYAPNTKHVSNIDACPQLSEGLGKVLSFLQKESSAFLGECGHVQMLEGDNGHVLLSIEGEVKHDLVERWQDNSMLKGVFHKDKAWGESTILVDGLRVNAEAFVQASKHGNQALQKTLRDVLSELSPKSVLELYAGAGNLTGCMENVVEIDAVEKYSSFSLKDSRVSFYKKDVKKFLSSIKSKNKYDCVVMDPPRKGAKDVMEPLMGLSFDDLIYVSCNPATFARDAKACVQKGMQLSKVVLIEMAPQTAHIEMVGVFKRA